MNDLAALALRFGRVGLFAFGGGPSMIPLMQEEVVLGGGWLTQEEFLEALALGNALPGPIAVKMAAFVGYKSAGAAGVAAALAGVCGPSLALMLGLTLVYLRHRENPALAGALRAAKPVVIGMLAWTVVALFPGGVPDVLSGVIALTAFGALAAGVHPAFVIAAAMGAGAAWLR